MLLFFSSGSDTRELNLQVFVRAIAWVSKEGLGGRNLAGALTLTFLLNPLLGVGTPTVGVASMAMWTDCGAGSPVVSSCNVDLLTPAVHIEGA